MDTSSLIALSFALTLLTMRDGRNSTSYIFPLSTASQSSCSLVLHPDRLIQRERRMLSRPGTRLDIGTSEDVMELELAEAHLHQRRQQHTSPSTGGSPPRSTGPPRPTINSIDAGGSGPGPVPGPPTSLSASQQHPRMSVGSLPFVNDGSGHSSWLTSIAHSHSSGEGRPTYQPGLLPPDASPMTPGDAGYDGGRDNCLRRPSPVLDRDEGIIPRAPVTWQPGGLSASSSPLERGGHGGRDKHSRGWDV